MLVAGHHLAEAQAIASLYPEGRVHAVQLDTRQVTADELCGLGVGIVIDAAGPFQASAPRLARAAIAAGSTTWASRTPAISSQGFLSSMGRPAPPGSSH